MLSPWIWPSPLIAISTLNVLVAGSTSPTFAITALSAAGVRLGRFSLETVP